MAEKKSIPYGTIAIFALWLGIIGLAYVLLMPSQKTIPSELAAVLRPEPRPLRPFTLVDQHNQSFTLDDLAGQWSLLFFGYTYCPDICPMTLSVLTSVLNELQRNPEGARNVKAVFVSVDPERDTPEVLLNYMEYFGEGFLGVTGKEQEINDFARQFGAGYIKEPERAPGEYLISHTSSIFLVDSGARLVAGFSPPHDPVTIAEQFSQIRGLD